MGPSRLELSLLKCLDAEGVTLGVPHRESRLCLP